MTAQPVRRIIPQIPTSGDGGSSPGEDAPTRDLDRGTGLFSFQCDLRDLEGRRRARIGIVRRELIEFHPWV